MKTERQLRSTETDPSKHPMRTILNDLFGSGVWTIKTVETRDLDVVYTLELRTKKETQIWEVSTDFWYDNVVSKKLK